MSSLLQSRPEVVGFFVCVVLLIATAVLASRDRFGLSRPWWVEQVNTEWLTVSPPWIRNFAVTGSRQAQAQRELLFCRFARYTAFLDEARKRIQTEE